MSDLIYALLNHFNEATTRLNREYYKSPSCIPALANILASSPQEAVRLAHRGDFIVTHRLQIRQLSAVELRKRVAQNSGALWIVLPQDERVQIKSKLPEVILAETK